jgi:hypothetical protein
MKKTILTSALVGVVGMAYAIPDVNGLLACTDKPVWESVTGGAITSAQNTILCWNKYNKSTATLRGRDNSVSNNCFTLGTLAWFNYSNDRNQTVTSDIKFDTRFLKNGREEGQALSKIAFGVTEVRSSTNKDDCATFPAMGAIIGTATVKGQAFNVVLNGVYDSTGQKVTRVCISEGATKTFTFKACLQAVPEASSLAAMGFGAIGFLAIRRKKK